MWIVNLLIVWAVTAISLYVISLLPLGVEIDGLKKAFWSAAVFGILNATLGWLLKFLTLPLSWISFGAFAFVVNVFIFGLAAWLVQGFRLRWGFWSAVIGAFLLSVINSVIFRFLPAALG
jgi:putative membrane protein